jgi:hypothetical protein
LHENGSVHGGFEKAGDEEARVDGRVKGGGGLAVIARGVRARGGCARGVEAAAGLRAIASRRTAGQAELQAVEKHRVELDELGEEIATDLRVKIGVRERVL